ncbi:MAG: hypothetical protein GX244_10865 [Firmicutes bacterium]|jgi:hypothetical protein|nr:hypothetical protein [Bacillota bacterium]
MMLKKLFETLKMKGSGGGCCNIEIVPKDTEEGKSTEADQHENQMKKNNNCCGQ